MYCLVACLFYKGPDLTYKICHKLQNQISIGDLVYVPLRNSHTWAVVKDIFESLPFGHKLCNIKDVISAYKIDSLYSRFVGELARYHDTEKKAVFLRIISLLRHAITKQQTFVDGPEASGTESYNFSFNEKQKECLQKIKSSSVDHPTVLYGYTGSGKTFIYAKLIQDAILQGHSAIFLAPEVSLAEKLGKIFSQFLGQENIFYIHANSTTNQKKQAFDAIIAQKSALFVGVHIPILLPIKNIGICIVDEEHDAGYQEKTFPFFHTKDIAIMRQRFDKYRLVLGSATPSIQSLYFAEIGKYLLVNLHQRFHQAALPKIYSVPLKLGQWITKTLQNTIQAVLEDKKQIMLFINRKGSHCFLVCNRCKEIVFCASCSLPYTVYNNFILKCHYCFEQKTIPTHCNKCGVSDYFFDKKGVGIQTITSLVEKMFPHAVVEQADFESAASKKSWQIICQKMLDRKIDILIGTQGIAKGYHFPDVDLVGIIWADMHLSIPHYLAREATVQQLIQVSGRAGRETGNGQVVLQAVGQTLSQWSVEEKYEDFYKFEIENRKELWYPPFCKTAYIILKNRDERVLTKEVTSVANLLCQYSENSEIKILGPAQAPRYKIKNIYTMFFLLKGNSYSELRAAIKVLKNKSFLSTIFYVPHPLNGIL